MKNPLLFKFALLLFAFVACGTFLSCCAWNSYRIKMVSATGETKRLLHGQAREWRIWFEKGVASTFGLALVVLGLLYW